jgi:putative salt-induced outer membrane protein YdiY
MTANPAPAALAALTGAVIGLVWASIALGDEVITTTGDRLTGTIVKADADSILLKTAYAGIIEIDRAQVRSLQPGAGQTSPVAPACADAAPVTVADAAQPDARGATTASAAADSRPGPAAARTGSSRSSPFTPGSELGGRVNFALSHEKGNTDKDEIDFDYHLDYRRGWHRFRSLGALEFDTNHSEKTTDKWATFNQYSRLFPSGWYGAAWLTLEHDRFADLRLRTLGGPAVGYLLAESEAFNLAVEAGPAVLQEDFYGHPDQDFTGAALFLRYDQLVWQDRLQPYHRQFGYAALDGDDKYLWQSWTGVRVPLAGGFTGAVEFEYDYDSDPSMEAKTTDTTLRLKLGYEW